MELRTWLGRFAGREDVTFAVEGCTGWRFVVEELQRAGITALLAEPAETAHQRGPKKRAKTDKTDARHLRMLVAEGRVPVSWIPPEQVCELRVLLQLYRDLREERTAWAQRIHATLFHQGVPSLAGRLSDPHARSLLERGEDIGLSPAGAQAVAAALRRMDDLEAALAPVHAQIAAFARRQPACKTLAAELYGVGPLVAAIVWAFLGDARRFSSSAQAVRHTGLDITVYSSDDKRTPGHLSHQGPPILRWALSRPDTRDHAPPPLTTCITQTWPRGLTLTGPRSRSPASSPAARTTSCAASATRPTPPCQLDGEAHADGRGSPHATDAPWPPPVAGALQPPCRRTVLSTAGRPRETGAATHQRDHPIDHHVAGTRQHRSRGPR